MPAKRLPGAMIDEVFDELNVLIGDLPEIKPFWKEKSYNTVRVLVRTTLPRFMWLGKVDKGGEALFQLAKLGKFRAVIKAKAFDRQSVQQLLNGFACLRRIPALDQAHPQIPAFSVDQSDQKPFPNTAVDRIALPVTDSDSATDRLRPFGNDSIRLDAVVIGVTGLNSLSATSEMLFSRDSRQFSELYVPIDCRDAKRLQLGKMLAPATANFFWRPETLQSVDDIVPFQRIGKQGKTLPLPAARGIKVLRAPVIVPVFVVTFFVRAVDRLVAVDLAADAGRTPFQNGCNLSKRIPLCQKFL